MSSEPIAPPQLDEPRPPSAAETRRSLRSLTSELIALQAERIRWLRQREIDAGAPMREITLALRVLEQYIDRAHSLPAGDGPAPEYPSPYGPADDDLIDVTPEEYAQVLQSLETLEGLDARQTRPSALPKRPASRAEMRRAKRLSKSSTAKAA